MPQHERLPNTRGPRASARARATTPASPSRGSDDLQRLASAVGNKAFGQALRTGAPTVSRRPTGTVTTRAGDQPIEGDTVTGGTGDYFDKVRMTMGLVSTRLAANAGVYGVQVLNACESFKTYANTKISDLEDEITGEALAGELVSAAVSVIGGQLTARITNAAYKFVADKISGYIRGKIVDGAKSAAGTGGEVGALKASIDSITQGARDASTGAGALAQSALDGRLRPLYQRCADRVPLGDEDGTLVGEFWDADPSTMDQQITEQFGIPSAADAAVAQVEIYNSLVRRFEKIYINKASSPVKNFEMANQEEIGDWNLSLPGRAKTAAGAATRERAGALNVDWRSFAHAGRSYEEAASVGMKLPAREKYELERENARLDG
jgi:hypothetical protein